MHHINLTRTYFAIEIHLHLLLATHLFAPFHQNSNDMLHFSFVSVVRPVLWMLAFIWVNYIMPVSYQLPQLG